MTYPSVLITFCITLQLERKRGSVVDSNQNGDNLDSSEDGDKLKKLLAENEKLHAELSEQEIEYKSQVGHLILDRMRYLYLPLITCTYICVISPAPCGLVVKVVLPRWQEGI